MAAVQEWVRQRIAAGCLSSHEFRLVAGSVRFSLMQTQSLRNFASWACAIKIGAEDAAWMGEMVKEALVAREWRAAGPFGHGGTPVLLPKRWMRARSAWEWMNGMGGDGMDET